MDLRPTIDELFERRITYPDGDHRERLSRLVGLDEHKCRLAKILAVRVNPQALQDWARRYQPGAEDLLVPVRKLSSC